MDHKHIEKIEIDLLLDGIFKRYGYDFKDYAYASLKRRLQHNLVVSNSKNYIDLLNKILYDEHAFQQLLLDLSVSVTEMFRDPFVYASIRKHVITQLKTYPVIKIWHAGCATGEEVYSMAILLHEEGLLDRTYIYATDINVNAIEIAKEGIYSADQIAQYTRNYKAAGGKKSLSDYYHAKYGSIKMEDFLKKNMTFAYHNLAIDYSFSEVQMILCRNVLIYFNRDLQDKVFELFDSSISHGGYLLIGTKETLDFTPIRKEYICVDHKARLYQKSYPEQ